MSDRMHAEFSHRLQDVPAHGVGLSVDVYDPDVSTLLRVLRQRQVMPAYMEVFRAIPTALAAVKAQAGSDLRLSYHGEGLWLTQPQPTNDLLFTQEVSEVASHLQILQSAWLNHECATKHVAGYSFGTYIPPLYTTTSAEIVADNTVLVQSLVDRQASLESGCTPLVLLEMPPLTYFVTGTIPIPTFFRLVTERAPCGLVLDVGHLWTVYRYTGAWKSASLMQFVDAFLAEFPLDRVVEIHVAGLAIHESSHAAKWAQVENDSLPTWTDAHAAPIPPVLFDILDRILSHPHLTSLKGLALEVDTKPVDLIVDEFERFSRRYASVSFASSVGMDAPFCGSVVPQRRPLLEAKMTALESDYEQYARVVCGRSQPEGSEWDGDSTCLEGLERYRSLYLPYEILHWGGDIESMFPESCRQLTERAIPLARFTSFWFCEPRPLTSAYDFFLIKISRFVEFIHEEAPDLDRTAGREAEDLRRSYQAANEPAPTGASEPV